MCNFAVVYSHGAGENINHNAIYCVRIMEIEVLKLSVWALLGMCDAYKSQIIYSRLVLPALPGIITSVKLPPCY